MKKPKGKVPMPPAKCAARARVLREMRALEATWRKWFAAGMPAQRPITKAELARRIGIVMRARAALLDK